MEEGFVEVRNPFNKSQVSKVSLNPKDVLCWVWWSKNYEKWIETYKANRSLFDSYKAHYFQFTINSPSELEGGVDISLEDRFKQIEFLINNFGVPAMNFRFDPIVIYKKPGSSKKLSNLKKPNPRFDILNSGKEEIPPQIKAPEKTKKKEVKEGE